MQVWQWGAWGGKKEGENSEENILGTGKYSTLLCFFAKLLIVGNHIISLFYFLSVLGSLTNSGLSTTLVEGINYDKTSIQKYVREWSTNSCQRWQHYGWRSSLCSPALWSLCFMIHVLFLKKYITQSWYALGHQFSPAWGWDFFHQWVQERESVISIKPFSGLRIKVNALLFTIWSVNE